MANVYYGDSVSTITGNWNTVSNWFSTIGNPCPCGGPTPGTLLGRVPNASTDNVILYYGFNGVANITTGPTGGYTGAITGSSAGVTIANGTYSGTINVAANMTISSAAVLSGAITVPYNSTLTVSGGTISGNINFNNHPTLAIGAAGVFSGGSFSNINMTLSNNSQLIISGGSYNNSRFIKNAATSIIDIKGGNWSPIASVTVSMTTNQIVASTLPSDPGFAFISGGLTPTYTINPIYNNILGTGLL